MPPFDWSSVIGCSKLDVCSFNIHISMTQYIIDILDSLIYECNTDKLDIKEILTIMITIELNAELMY